MAAATTEKAYDDLRDAILTLDLLPGEPLSERGLEELLGTSRTPVRAALLRLEGEGLAQRAGRGWRVAPIDLAEVRSVMEFREALETAAVARAIERAEASDIDALMSIVEVHHDTDDPVRGLRDGVDFHLALAGLSENFLFVEGIRSALTRLTRTRWIEVRTAESRAQARREHLEIIAAMRSRDAGRAVELVAAHARGTRDRLVETLDQERLRLRARGLAIVDSARSAG
jgi:DNA-binding GntR family transcriptional regulator